ncbi:unnamed protein product, partial [Didymodactylos carnosus]
RYEIPFDLCLKSVTGSWQDSEARICNRGIQRNESAMTPTECLCPPSACDQYCVFQITF